MMDQKKANMTLYWIDWVLYLILSNICLYGGVDMTSGWIDFGINPYCYI